MNVKAHAVVARGRVERYGELRDGVISPDRGECESTVFYNGIIALVPQGWCCPAVKVDACSIGKTAAMLAAAIPDGGCLTPVYIPLC